MDKLLLAAYLSSLAGFITAVISIVKLVNEKENKTSEFRQAWTNSVRTSISDLAAKLTSMTANLEQQSRLTNIEKKLDANTGQKNEERLKSIRELLFNTRREIGLNRHDLFKAYALCKLHFKPNDPEFNPIEQKFDLIFAGNTAMADGKDATERSSIKAKNYAYSQDIVEMGRVLLKKEWERVKEGEDVYKYTKKYSFIGGVIMLIILLLTGLYSFLLITKAHEDKLNGATITAVVPNKSDISSCWQLQNFGRRIFKLNSCTGELIELGMELTSKPK